MLGVIVSWLLALVIFIALGCLIQKYIFSKHLLHPFYMILNGMFVYMLIIWLLLYFNGFNIYFQAVSFFFSLLILRANRKECQFFDWIKKQFRSLTIAEKLLFFLGVILLSAEAANMPSLPDNETYYIQTIKWANQNGFAYGLMNIHPFLGQFSGWHILQSGVNLSNPLFVSNNLNSLFLLLFVGFVLLDKQAYFSSWIKYSGFFVFLFLYFSKVPAPDLSVWLLSLLIFDLFIKNFKQINTRAFLQLSFLVFLSFLIKPTGIMNVILWLILGIKHFKKLDKSSKVLSGLLGVGLLVLWLSKNYILTGYLFYPFDFFATQFQPQWQYPNELLQYLSKLGSQEHAALKLNREIGVAFFNWLQSGNFFENILKILWILLLFLFPLLLHFKRYKLSNYQAYLVIYLSGLLYFILLLFISPNVRFYLAYLIFLTSVSMFLMFPKSIFKNTTYASLFLFLFGLLFMLNRQYFYESTLLFPVNSKLSYRFVKQKEYDFEYYYPNSLDLFWETGDAPLPAVHQKMLYFFKENFGYFPQKSKENTNMFILKKLTD